jgi:hypothetical protein
MTTSYHVEEARRRSRVQEACLYPNGTVHNTSTTVVHTMKERRMNRNVGKIVVCAFVFTLTCASGGWAQQPQPSGGTPVSQAPPPATGVPAAGAGAEEAAEAWHAGPHKYAAPA